jgi:replicative DNA helicase
MRQVEHILSDFPMPDSSMMERKLLNSVLTDMTYFSELMRIVRPECFSNEKNRVVWRVIVDMFNRGETVDITTVFPKVDRKHFTEEIIGSETVFGQGILELGAALWDTYVKRIMYKTDIEALQAITNGEPAPSILARHTNLAKEIRDKVDSGVAKTTQEVVNRLADNIQSGKKARIATPFTGLNYYLYGGLGSGNLVILAARPSVGKTTIALQMAMNASRNGIPTSYYSLEMTDEELVQRLIVGTGLVSTLEIVNCNVNWENYERAAQMVTNKYMAINDRARSLDEICTSIALDAQAGRCKIAFIDYLGLISYDDRRKTLAQVIGDITKRFKNLAQECNIPIVLLCQLNRESAKEGRSPQLTDLRDSGSIEQDADIVIMLERPKDEFGVVKRDHIDLWLRKNRGGNCTEEEALHLVGNDSYADFHEEVHAITYTPEPEPEPTPAHEPVDTDLFDKQEDF